MPAYNIPIAEKCLVPGAHGAIGVNVLADGLKRIKIGPAIVFPHPIPRPLGPKRIALLHTERNMQSSLELARIMDVEST